VRSIPVRTRHRYGLGVVVPAIVTVVGYVAVHSSVGSRPDGFAPRWVALTLIPALGAVLLTLFAVLPRIGPSGESVRQFRVADDWFVGTRTRGTLSDDAVRERIHRRVASCSHSLPPSR